MVNDKPKRLPPSHYTLLEASREKQTTSTKVLAYYLERSPATIRTQFQRILEFLDVHCRYEAIRKAEEHGLIRKQKRLAPAPEEDRDLV
ncbi:response regulator transcription factor [Betaproteobacteria bacterium PRO4]|uniref:DNA-binding response regulator n=1 Tax=Nitrosomonas sp. TaxID=42353 RepID=UPI00256A2C63|nr:DNA-binding response regulator [Nitrosomonas sp.]MBE7526241.1 response regulator transcription factor [Burkholderiales bacterium]MDL1867647.1 response regulator transcription factor [Betaproteobacteria bacterium PRO4]